MSLPHFSAVHKYLHAYLNSVLRIAGPRKDHLLLTNLGIQAISCGGYRH